MKAHTTFSVVAADCFDGHFSEQILRGGYHFETVALADKFAAIEQAREWCMVSVIKRGPEAEIEQQDAMQAWNEAVASNFSAHVDAYRAATGLDDIWF